MSEDTKHLEKGILMSSKVLFYTVRVPMKFYSLNMRPKCLSVAVVLDQSTALLRACKFEKLLLVIDIDCTILALVLGL